MRWVGFARAYDDFVDVHEFWRSDDYMSVLAGSVAAPDALIRDWLLPYALYQFSRPMQWSFLDEVQS